MKTQLRQGALFLFSFLLLLGVFALPLFADQPTLTSSPTPSVEYSLPYPGILPDNPLYLIKAARDKIVSFFISDPKEKATFDLLQADKRLAAAFTLSKQQPTKGSLVVQTVSKGENYFSDAVGQAGIAIKQGEEINGLLGQMMDASKKHAEIIIGIQHSLSQNDSEELTRELRRVQEFENQVTKLRPH